MEVQVVYDRTELTDSVLDTVTHNLVGGAVLVTLTLLILLGNVPAGLLVAVCIPLAMLFAVLGMNYFAITASLLSLGAIDFGLIVDGSVVMTEANLRGLADRTRQAGRKLTIAERFDCILESSRSVARPSFSEWASSPWSSCLSWLSKAPKGKCFARWPLPSSSPFSAR